MISTLLIIALARPGVGFHQQSYLLNHARRTRPLGAATPPPRSSSDDGIAVLEDQVVAAIRDGFGAGLDKPGRLVGALKEFGGASGALFQTWLTPQTLERCAGFWADGGTCFARDLQRGRAVRSFKELGAVGWFGLLALNTFPVTPLLLPLIDRALQPDVEQASYVPASFRERRRAALRRLQQEGGTISGDVGDDEATSRKAYPLSPQNLEEGTRFFGDGSRLLFRDLRRGGLFGGTNNDTTSSYLWFAALTFSTFPLTPLLLPLIDKRRGDPLGRRQSEYVPSSFRPRRLAALRRLSKLSAAKASAGGPTGDAITVLRAAANSKDDGDRPAPADLVASIAATDPSQSARAHFLEGLAGGGSPGRRWRLVFVADKAAVARARRDLKEARKQQVATGDAHAPMAGTTAAPLLLDQMKALVPKLPWAEGFYVDGLVTAVQRFDLETFENENGVFGLLGILDDSALRLTVKGPFKWPQPERGRTVCAFQPLEAECRLLGRWTFSVPMAADGASEDFQSTSPTKLPFFKFVHVDEKVAVAQGRSGSVAVWTSI
mmetsp:Transcript_53865/g.122786  ORF Transcript_53865/g.122786 Transcript_53865/m.122786 type:complete len:549 (-) Transcript_53865:286-1932(-)